MMIAHHPVLLEETLQGLNIRPDGLYVDCTFGRGGHSQALLSYLGNQGKVLAFDQDPHAVAVGKEMEAADPRFRIVQANFSTISQYLTEYGWLKRVTGILFDLGVSSPQLDTAERGFSFMRDGLLDMRMNPTEGDSAMAWLVTATVDEITTVLREYGEEPHARRIAKAIDKARQNKPIEKTQQLAEIIVATVPQGNRQKTFKKPKHPATLTFQAIRIHINQEIAHLVESLPQAVDALEKGGRLAIISFHSIEDRVVKRFLRNESRGDKFPIDMPVTTAMLNPRLQLLGKPIFPGELEIERNPRARSAVLRIAERL